MNKFIEPISKTVWDIKYRYRLDGKNIDQSVEDTWQRVAKAIASAEKQSEQAFWQKQFYHLLEDFRFLPGGRILAGAGTTHKVTLFNCFVMDIGSDSLSGIFAALQEGALTLQQGGGVGYDFSVLRPRGEIVKKTGIAASGPISFMRIWDTMCSVLLSTGARRGAMMGVLRADHPDIEEFIAAKKDPHELRHFNVSVMVSDEFMEAVKNNADWQLVFPTEDQAKGQIVFKQWGNSLQPIPCQVYRVIKARELWADIIRSAYEYAEPGVLFGDTINRMNNLYYRERINATNPCGEIPLPAYGACNLGAINLTQFIISPFTPEAQIAWSKIEETVSIATRFLDNIVDVSEYPLTIQKNAAEGSRRIGLGITGLADAFIMLGMRYGSEESLALGREIMQRIAYATWQTSIQLAKEKGAFPFYAEDYLDAEFAQSLPESMRGDLKQNGVRNSHHNTIAPTGTISLLANNVSNGIEPVFRAEYNRRVRDMNGELMTFYVTDYAYQLWKQQRSGVKLPPAWVDTKELTPDDHLAMQGVMQPYIDNAISKTINIPADFPFEQLSHVYTKAYALGLKGCTVFRPNPVTGSVLEELAEEEENVDRCCQDEREV